MIFFLPGVVLRVAAITPLKPMAFCNSLTMRALKLYNVSYCTKKDFLSKTYFKAIPLQREMIFKAVRSPNKILRALP
jgi:hypothetical protein